MLESTQHETSEGGQGKRGELVYFYILPTNTGCSCYLDTLRSLFSSCVCFLRRVPYDRA